MSLLAQEKNPSKGIIQSISKNVHDQTRIEVQSETKISKWSSINQAFAEVFLPRGYPNSVCADYLSYQIWDSLQAYGSSITGTLATHNVLKGIGVGDKSASVMGATFTWLLRDGTGMVGRIVFTYFKGSNLDVDCKKWRLFADIINDIAIGLDMICPFFSDYLLLLQCSSGFLKSLVGTVGGATRAALTQHQARNNNLADVSAKDASQETLVNLAALLTSLAIVPLISGSDLIVWTLFVILTMTHIYCNYRAVRSVHLEVFNPSRFTSFIEEYIFMEKVGSIGEINQRESVFCFSNNKFQDRIESGVPLSDHYIPDGQVWTDFLEYNSTRDYILSFDFKRSNSILISLIENQDSVRNKLKAYFHANLILFYSFKYKTQAKNLFKFSENMPSMDIVSETEKIVNQKFEKMLTDANKKGWKLDNFIFLDNGWRITQLYNKKYE